MKKRIRMDNLPANLKQDCGMSQRFDRTEHRPMMRDYLEASFMGLECICCPAPERVWRVS